MKNRILILILLGFCCNIAQSQTGFLQHSPAMPSRFTRIPIESLPETSINCLQQGPDGFMWFGTADGLVKFDGYDFTIFRNDIRDATSISANSIISLFCDRTGTIWIGTLIHGLNKYNRSDGTFTRYRHAPGDSFSITGDQIRAIQDAADGGLWIGTGNGLNRLDRSTGRFKKFIANPADQHSLSGTIIYGLCESRYGEMWISTNRGLSVYHFATGLFQQFLHDPEDQHSLDSNAPISVFEDRQGTMWVGTVRGFNRFDREQNHFTRFAIKPLLAGVPTANLIWAIQQDTAGKLWLGTVGGGILIFNPVTEKMRRFIHDPVNPYSLSSNYITSIFRDHSNNLWIGAGGLWGLATGSGLGINLYENDQKPFYSYAPDPANPYDGGHGGYHVVFEDHNGDFWAGTRGQGLQLIDLARGAVKKYVHNPSNPNSISGNGVMSLLEDHLGYLWVGTGSNGLNRFDKQRKRFTRYLHDPRDSTSLSHNRVVSIFEDRFNKLWVPTFGGGLNRFDRATEKFTRFVSDSQDSSSISWNQLSMVYEDRAGTLWVGTWGGGFNRFNRETGQFTRFLHDPENPLSLSNNFVWGIYEDKAGAFWLATTGGLNKFDRATGKFSVYTEKNGLSDNLVYSIFEDRRGRLWLNGGRGISCFDPVSERFSNYYIDDGLLNLGFSFGATFKSKSGMFYFPGTNGIDYFHPDSIKPNTQIPPVVFTRFTYFSSDDPTGEPVVDNNITARKSVEVSYRERTLNFEFAALNYKKSNKNVYTYKLDGFDQNWIYLGNKHDVSFTNLEPGEYTLLVKGANNDGIWNDKPTALKISITPPWWKTNWATALFVIIILTSLYGMRRYELTRVYLRNELQIKNIEADKFREVDQMKSRFFADISHEFRTPLTLILGPFEKVYAALKDKQRREDLRIMQRNGRRLLRLVEQLLDLSRIEAGGMRLQAIQADLVVRIKEWVASFASLAERRKMLLQLECPEGLLLAWFDPDKLEKIIYNLLSNAFKFTPDGGQIQVILSRLPRSTTDTTPGNEGQLQISVKDSGPGIAVKYQQHIFDRFYRPNEARTGEQGGVGIGLALTKELVELHRGELRLHSEPGNGAEFKVILPLGSAHLAADEMVDPAVEENKQTVHISAVDSGDEGSETRAVDSDRLPETSRPLVLVVEDNTDMRRYLQNCLAPNFEIFAAENGKAGFQSACAKLPDLIVSDVMMPVMDGFALCKKLKTDGRTSHIPLILLTARAEMEDRLEGLETGADDYLTKPFNEQELLVRAKNLIAQRRRLREMFRNELIIKPTEVTATSMDAAFLQKAIAIVEKHMDDTDFNTADLARQVGYSVRQLNRKLKPLTSHSARGFIRSIRLKRAAQLLQQKSGTVTEIAYETGFQSLAHFAKVFRRQFGAAPSEFSGTSD